jgi:two-component system, NarL family, sensor kinase
MAAPKVPVKIPARASRRLGCLLDVARVINSSLELSVVLDHILSQARAILGAESGSIMLVDDATRQLYVLAAQGPRAQDILGQRQETDEGVAGWVACEGKPLLLHGPILDPCLKTICDRQDVRDALSVPLRAEDQILGVINLSNRQGRDTFSDEDLELLTALSHQAALAIRNAKSFQEMRHQRKTVERLLAEVARAHEEERKRIALLIHDGPAQTLFAALRNLEAGRALAADGPPGLVDALSELERTIRQAIDETRALMVDLRPPTLDEMGLEAALQGFARQFEQRTGIRTQVVCRNLEERLPPMVEGCFYRIAQEALTNVWKHAEATQARITVELEERFCSLEIEDSGKGFDPEAASVRERHHIGLSSLRDRAELIGGRLTVSSAPGEGTVVRVSVPIAG